MAKKVLTNKVKTSRKKISIKPNISKLKKAAIVAAMIGALGVGGYNELVVKPKVTAKIESDRKIAETKKLTNNNPQNVSDFYTEEVISIYGRLISKGSSKITAEDINLANRELLSHKGVVYFDPIDRVFVLRPYTDFGKTQSQAYEIIKEAKGFRHVWFDKKVYEFAYDARANLNSKKPNQELIKKKIKKANEIITNSGGQREIRLEKVLDKSNNPIYRIVLYNKLTSEKVYDF